MRKLGLRVNGALVERGFPAIRRGWGLSRRLGQEFGCSSLKCRLQVSVGRIFGMSLVFLREVATGLGSSEVRVSR